MAEPRTTRRGSDDRYAVELLGSAYEAVPKGVWAALAWSQALSAKGPAETATGVIRRRLESLISNGLVPRDQGDKALQALDRGQEN